MANNRIICLFLTMLTLANSPVAFAADTATVKRLNAPPPPAMPAFIRRGTKAIQLHNNKVLKFSAKATDSEISAARIFPEPLCPMSTKPVPGENQALTKALSSFKSKGDCENVSDLNSFLAKYPRSRWRASLELNLGQCRFESGYPSDALRYWKSAWTIAKPEKGQLQTAVANGAISRLLMLEARLGKMEDISSQLAEIKNRPMRGSDETRVHSARTGLETMKTDPGIAFKCGPYAINSLLFGKEHVKSCHPTLYKAASTIKGTNLWQLKGWATEAGLDYQPAKRMPNSPIVVPAVMHWKVGHFAAITEEADGRYRLKDPTFDTAGDRWLSKKALDAESDGYFLVPAGKLPNGWRALSQQEAENVWGKGFANDSDMDAMTPDCPRTKPMDQCEKGMAQAAFWTMQTTTNISDIPLTYSPPVGPEMNFRVNYNYLENNQPGSFAFTTLGKNWTLNWLSYLTLDASKNATVRVSGGGCEVFTNTGTVGSPAYANPNLTSQSTLAIVGGNYQRRLPDGTIELFNDTDGTGRIFMTQVFDPQGNSISIQYDSNFRISTITDAIGQTSALTYATNSFGSPGYYNLTQISDPFGRTATFTYDSTYALLLSITDQIGLVSKFTYDSGSNFVTAMTTPYGTTSFYSYTPARPSNKLPTGLRISFPDGTSCVVENWKEHILQTYYWDREAMSRYPNDPANSVNPVYSSTWHCAVTEWQLLAPTTTTQSPVPNWYEPALTQTGSDTRTSYYYDGSTATGDGDHYWTGPSNKPNTVTQNTSEWDYTYNTYGHMTQSIDPKGRKFSYTYAANNIDLIQAKQVRGSNNDVIGQWSYNQFSAPPTAALSQHLPLSYINGSGQQTIYSYNAFGQTTQVCDPRGNVWKYTYGSIPGNSLPAYLTQIDGPLSGNQDVTTFTYDGYGRVYQATNSQGYTLTYSYDNADRITQITYMDGTYDQIVYDRLDQILFTDRLGRVTQNSYDSMRQLAYTVDPLGRKTKYTWCGCGAVMCLTDPAGHTTTMHHDLEGRLSSKVYANGTKYSYTYNNFGLLQNRTDALSQVTNYSYNSDLSLAETSYSKAVNPTSSVYVTYDPNYPRVTNRQNGNSGLSYTYNPYLTSTGGIATLTLGGSPTTGDVVSVTVANTTATNVSLTGTPTTGNVVNVLVINNNLSGGKYNLQYTVQAGDTTLSTLASSIATAINGNGTLSAANISASASSSNVKISAYGATGAFSILPNANGTVTETVGGSINAGDVVSVSVFDAGIPSNTSTGLPAGQRTYSYTVGGGDTTITIANQLSTAINADATLSGLGITASWSGGNSYFTISSNSANQTQYAQWVSPAGNETITLTGGPSEAAATAILPSSSTTVNYTVQSSDTTLTTLANSIKTAINANSALSNAGVTATANASYGVIYLSAPAQFGVPAVTVGVSGVSPTETITTAVSGSIYFSGTPTTGNRINVTVYNDTLSGDSVNLQYTVQSGDTTAALLASSVASAINANSTISAAQIAATASGSIVTLTAPPAAGTVGITANANGTVTETLTFSGTLGDTFSITVYDPALPGGQATASYTASVSDTATVIAAALAFRLNSSTHTSGIVATSSGAVVSINSSTNSRTVVQQKTTGTSTIVQGGGSTSTILAGSAFGAGKLSSTANTAINNSMTTYIYDSLGRTTNRSINGPANSTTWEYDAINRVTSEVNPLGTFNYGYLDNSPGSSKGDPRLASITYPNSQTTTFNYLPNILDQRLQQIVNANPSAVMVSQFNYAYDPAGQIRQWQQQQNAGNIHTDYDYDLAGQLTSAQSDSGSIFKAYIGGAVHAGDVVSVTAYDASLTGTVPVGQETASYTVTGGDTASSIATALASSINSTMSNISATASSSGSMVTISTSPNYTTSFTCAVTGAGATDTIALSQSSAISPLHKQNYYKYDCASNIVGMQGDSTGSFPSGLTTTAAQATYDCVNQLTEVKAAGPVAFQATTVNPVKSAVVNLSQTATISGNIQAGDVLYLSVHDKQLPQAEIIAYTVGGSDTLTTIASAITTAINANMTLSTLGVTATSVGAVITISSTSSSKTSYSQAASPNAKTVIALNDIRGASENIKPSTSFASSPKLAVGTNTASVTAVSGGGTATTDTYPVTIANGTSKSFSSDANGNMTNTTTGAYPQYSYDAENRIIQMNYGGTNSTNITYDAAGRYSQISETYNGAVLSISNLVWCGDEICETRLSDNSSWRQYFSLGQINFSGGSNTNYFYNFDHVESVREMTGTDGGVVDQYSYDSWGVGSKIVGVGPDADFGYANMYLNSRSGLYLTKYRAFSPSKARWLSRDPMGISAGTNEFIYVGNRPISYRDPSGLGPINAAIWGTAGATGGYYGGALTGGVLSLPGGGGLAIPGAVAGALLGGMAGTAAGWLIPDPKISDIPDPFCAAKPPKNALDPNGPKAPGNPADYPETGFEEPKGGPNWVPNPNGPGKGFEAADGNVWVPSGPKGHGGPHWDVQVPGRAGTGFNVYPGGRVR
ncbi:MAG: hypothetical protein K2Y22_07430 [Candidatus Obscuribacterales bacterium]|nr:hypothetical protein [Candidatus Obscuribacterales bacterium]